MIMRQGLALWYSYFHFSIGRRTDLCVTVNGMFPFRILLVFNLGLIAGVFAVIGRCLSS